MAFSDNALRSLGNYMVAFSQVEGSLAVLVAGRIDSRREYVGSSVASEVSTRALLKIARALTDEAAAPVLKAVAAAEDERNRMLHATWLEHFKGGGRDAMWRSKNRAPSPKDPTIATMSEVTPGWLDQRADELRQLATEVQALIPPGFTI